MDLVLSGLENDELNQWETFRGILDQVGVEILSSLKSDPAMEGLAPNKRIRGKNALDIFIPSTLFHFYTELSYINMNGNGNILVACAKDILLPDHMRGFGLGKLMVKSWEDGLVKLNYTGDFYAHDVSDQVGLDFWAKQGYRKVDESRDIQAWMIKSVQEK